MSRLRAALLAAMLLPALVLTGCGGAADSSPGSKATATKLITLAGDGFSIGLPVKAVPQTQAVNTEAGQIELTLYLAEGDEGTFVVAMTPIPDGAAPSLDGAVNGAVGQVKGTLKERSTTKVLGRPARAARYVANVGGQDVTIFARVVSVGSKLFQVQFVVPAKDLDKPPAVFAEVLASLRFE